jgi:hypothetical protein
VSKEWGGGASKRASGIDHRDQLLVTIEYTPTGHQSPGIRHQGETPLLTTPAISIQGSEAEADIKKHIESQLATDLRLKGWSSDLKVCIGRALVKGQMACECTICNIMQNLIGLPDFDGRSVN